MKAILKSDFAKTSVENGVISGVRLMEVNRTAHFKGADGKAKSIEITPELIAALLAHAGNRSIPSHLSHDHFGAETDAIHARLGSVKNIRIDAAGNMVGDLHTMPNENGRLALWLAENDPENAAMSAIFDYNAIVKEGKTYAVPLNFQTADLVAAGAACSALLSQNPNDTDMTKEEIVALIKEHSISKDDLTAALSALKPGLTESDVDSKVTAALGAYKPVMSDDEKKSVALLAKAELTKEIGTLGLVQSTQKAADEFESAVTAQLSAGAKDRPTAILRLAADKPEIYNAAVASGRI